MKDRIYDPKISGAGVHAIHYIRRIGAIQMSEAIREQREKYNTQSRELGIPTRMESFIQQMNILGRRFEEMGKVPGWRP